MSLREREEEWAAWLRAGMGGDTTAYNRFLTAITPFLRASARRQCDRFGLNAAEAEDVLQEVLIVVHLKRGSWDPQRPLGPWLSTIVRNKFIDALRRRTKRRDVPIEDFVNLLHSEDRVGDTDAIDAERLVGQLPSPQGDIVRAISLRGEGIRETAQRLQMSEGAVRVALHRALKTLGALYRRDAQ